MLTPYLFCDWRDPPEFYPEALEPDASPVPDVVERLAQVSGARAPHLDAPLRGPLTLRETLSLNCYIKTRGVVAREFQLDVGEALQGREDMIVQAFTGSGKSLAMVVLLFTYPGKFVIIASPLNNLEENMCEGFCKWGLTAYAYNSNVRTPAIEKELAQHRFDVLATSPERLIEPGALRPFLVDSAWTSSCAGICVDEGHCIRDWGESGFRPAYAKLSLLRSFLSPDVPFLVVSATLAPATISSLARQLFFRPGFKILNLGNVRENIFWEVRTVQGSMKKALPYLRFLLPSTVSKASLRSIPSTIVFVTSRQSSQRVATYLRGFLPDSLAFEAITPLHAKSKPNHIKEVLERFDNGTTRILVATTIAGLGRDFRNVTRVCAYMAPENLESWVQEAGRGARKETVKCTATLLVSHSAFTLKSTRGKKKKKKLEEVEEAEDVEDAAESEEEDDGDSSSSSEDEEPLLEADPDGEQSLATRNFEDAMAAVNEEKYVKKMSPHFRAFIAPANTFKPEDLCRCQILSGYFDNPTTPINLCDVCRLRHEDNPDVLSKMPLRIEDLTLPSDVRPSAQEPSNIKARAPASRTGDALADALKRLEDWRLAEWTTSWQDSGLMLADVVSDDVLAAVSRALKLLTREDLAATAPAYIVSRFGEQLLAVMHAVHEAETAVKRAAQAEREREAARKAAEKEAEKAAKAAEKTRIATEKAAEKARVMAEKAAQKQRALEEKARVKEEKTAEKARIKEEKSASRGRGAARARGGSRGRGRGRGRGGAVATAVGNKRPASPTSDPAQVPERKRARALEDLTNSPPKPGPSRRPDIVLPGSIPMFNLPSLRGQPPPSLPSEALYTIMPELRIQSSLRSAPHPSQPLLPAFDSNPLEPPQTS